MMGSLLTRGLMMILGYAYPAYECFKNVEKNKPEIIQLQFWCQYWILVAFFTVFERIGDVVISWFPLYDEAKVALVVYLWHPKTRGTVYVYNTFLRPYVAKHEADIDKNLVELKTRAGDIAVLYWQKSSSYLQTRVFEILQYFASQSSKATTEKQPKTQTLETIHDSLTEPENQSCKLKCIPPISTEVSSNTIAKSEEIEPVSQAANETVTPHPQERSTIENAIRSLRERFRRKKMKNVLNFRVSLKFLIEF